MKKYIKLAVMAMISVCIVTITGCKSSDQGGQENKQDFNTSIATNIVEIYMGMLQKGEFDGIKKYYSKDILEKQKETGNSMGLITTGWVIDDISEVGSSALYKIKVSKSATDKPVSTLDKLSIKVIKEEGEYKIKDINVIPEKEVFNEGMNLRIRNKNEVKTSLLIDMVGLPAYVYQKDDAGKLSKIPITKQQFSMASISYGGSRVAVTSYDKGSYLGIIKVEESVGAQGKDQGGGGQNSGGQENQTISRETPVGKEINSIDYIMGARIYFTAFSKDEKFILAQYETNDKGLYLRCYNVDSSELINVKLTETFDPQKFNLIFSSFDKDALNIEVKERVPLKNDDRTKIGKWQISLKDFKIKKL